MESSSLVRMKSTSHDNKFEVNYSKLKDYPLNKYISFPSFDFEGYEWAIYYYPKYMSLYSQYLSLRLLSKDEDVRAEFSFSLLLKNETHIVSLGSSFYTFNADNKSHGHGKLFLGNDIESFLDTDNIFIISCKIRIFSGPRDIVNINSGGLHEHMEKLLYMSDKFDVTFEVEGKKISAHRLILVARSPVFEEELFGSMAEVDMKCIRIEEMKADVFRAMLRFMYTDQISSGRSRDLKRMSIEFVQDLFVAADRYALEKMKKNCEEMLCDNLSVRTVSTTLLLADRHSCPWLKAMCLRFASKPENFMQIALTEEYNHMIQVSPSLLVELREKCNNLSGRGNKKQRIV